MSVNKAKIQWPMTVQTKLNNREGGERDKGVAYRPLEPCN